eukprot:jgi/Mesen1/2341/ME000155S01421
MSNVAMMTRSNSRRGVAPHDPSLTRVSSLAAGIVEDEELQTPKPKSGSSSTSNVPEPLKRAIIECTLQTLPALAVICDPLRTLQDYLGDPATVDVVYLVLLEHALAECERSPQVLVKCAALLKKYLFMYVPSHATLQQIHLWCAKCIADQKDGGAGGSASEARQSGSLFGSLGSFTPQYGAGGATAELTAGLSKSLRYVQSIVIRHLPTAQSAAAAQAEPAGSRSEAQYRAAMAQVAGGLASAALQRASEADRVAAQAAALTLARLNPPPDSSDLHVPSDLLAARWSAGPKSWAPLPVITGSGGLSRPHLEAQQCDTSSSAAALLLGPTFRDADMVVSSTLVGTTEALLSRSQLRVVSSAQKNRGKLLAKRAEADTGGAGGASVRRARQRQLFQYRYYSEQQALRLSEAEMEDVIAGVCRPPSHTPMASSSGTATPTPVIMGRTTTLSRTMSVGGGAAARGGGGLGALYHKDSSLLASTVLVKLLIDMYMADAYSAAPLALSLLQGMLEVEATAVRLRAFDLLLNLGVHGHLLSPYQPDSGSAEGAGVPGGGESQRFEQWLVVILCEMLLYLVQAEETDEVVWTAGLSCLLYLASDRGHLLRARLGCLDVRVAGRLVEGWAQELHAKLVHLATALLYPAYVGVARFCWEEQGQAGQQARLDLLSLRRLGGISVICSEADEVAAVVAALSLAGAADSMVSAFRSCQLLGDLAAELDELAAAQTAAASQLEPLVALTLEHPSGYPPAENRQVATAWTTLRALLHSERSSERLEAHKWLLRLLAHRLILPGTSQPPPGLSLVEQLSEKGGGSAEGGVRLLKELLQSGSHAVRCGYMWVVERLLALQAAHAPAAAVDAGEREEDEASARARAADVLNLMAAALWHVVAAGEADRIIMCSMVLGQLCVPLAPSAADGSSGGRASDRTKALNAAPHRKSDAGASASRSGFPGRQEGVCLARHFLQGRAAASQELLELVPVALLFWPIMQLAPSASDGAGMPGGGAGGRQVAGSSDSADLRAALLLLLIGKCLQGSEAMAEIGGDAFFKSLLDDADARIAYFSSTFLLKRMMKEQPEEYQRALHRLVFTAQQSNNEKLLENPYLQVLGLFEVMADS